MTQKNQLASERGVSMQEFIEKLKTIDMSENEAKVYAVLFELKVATPGFMKSARSAKSRIRISI